MRIFIYEPCLIMSKALREIFLNNDLFEVELIGSLEDLSLNKYAFETDLVISGQTLGTDWNYTPWIEGGAYSRGRILFFIEKIHATKIFLFDVFQLLNVSILIKEETGSSQLVDAVKCAQRNQVSISSYIQTLVTKMRRKLSNNESLYETLSEREKLYVKLYCETLSPTQIAHKMNVSISTVNSFKEKVLHKFSLESVHELIQYCAHDDMMRQYIPNPKALNAPRYP